MVCLEREGGGPPTPRTLRTPHRSRCCRRDPRVFVAEIGGSSFSHRFFNLINKLLYPLHSCFSGRLFLFLFWLFVAWSPALVLGVLIYLRVNLNVSEFRDADAGFFHRYFSLVQYFLYLLTAVFAGAGLIANDRRTNALQIYLSKPIRAPLLFEKLSIWGDVYPVVVESLGNASPTQDEATATSTETQPSPSQQTAKQEAAIVVPETNMINWDSALNVAAGDEDLLKDLLAAILEECPEQMALLDSSIAACDSSTARRAAHTILGNMRTVLAQEAMEKASVVEQLAKDGLLEGIDNSVEDLRSAINNALAEIRCYLG